MAASKRRRSDVRHPPPALQSARPGAPGSSAARIGRDQTEKLSPQEQEALAFGLVNLKPPAIKALE